jgi:tripartite-type tricarboxylate transporter receptor subunit TctC
MTRLFDALLLAALPALAFAQAPAHPNRPAHRVVGFPAGGGADELHLGG